MASGSSGRNNYDSKGSDFESDDILHSYEDYPNQDLTNGSHSEPNSSKDYHKSRLGRSSIFPASYSPSEDTLNHDLGSTVEKSMKKYADNLVRFLEGISSRLSQLELYCYNLDKSIGEMRLDLIRDHGEADAKLKSLEKHLQEVHRSVQILRDKQELADTQKEIAKLQLVQKESSPSSHSQSNEERTSPPSFDSQKIDNTPNTNNQQLVLALPHQVAQQQQPVAPLQQASSQNMTQQQSYYLPPTQLSNPPAPHSQFQYVPSDSQYRPSQMQDMTRVSPQPTQSQVKQAPSVQSFPHYQQQVPQQLPQQAQLPQQSAVQTQIRPTQTTLCPPYPQSHSSSPSPEPLASSVPMQLPYSGIPPQGSSCADTMPFGYVGAGRTVPHQPPPQQNKCTYGAPLRDGYASSGPHPSHPLGSTYMMYDGEGGRSHYQHQVLQFAQGGYPPTSASLPSAQVTTPPNVMVRNPQFSRNYPYREVIEKLTGIGFTADHVASVIQRMEDSGQPIDFNTVLERLNVHCSGGPQRGWSG